MHIFTYFIVLFQKYSLLILVVNFLLVLIYSGRNFSFFLLYFLSQIIIPLLFTSKKLMIWNFIAWNYNSNFSPSHTIPNENLKLNPKQRFYVFH
jgi:hypothetical protein